MVAREEYKIVTSHEDITVYYFYSQKFYKIEHLLQKRQGIQQGQDANKVRGREKLTQKKTVWNVEENVAKMRSGTFLV